MDIENKADEKNFLKYILHKRKNIGFLKKFSTYDIVLCVIDLYNLNEISLYVTVVFKTSMFTFKCCTSYNFKFKYELMSVHCSAGICVPLNPISSL